MKFIVSVILIILFSYALGLIFSWWTIAISAFVVSVFIPQRPLASFLCGALAIFLFWGGMSWMIDFANHQILSRRISLLIFKNNNPYLLILMTALIGSVVAGLASLAGSFVHKKV